jgi:hypothetical protein
MADEAPQTVDEVIIAFQKALGRAWRASEEAMKADPGIAGGARQLFGVSQLDIELACVVEPSAEAADKLAVRLNPPPGGPASVLRFRVEAKPVNVTDFNMITLSKAAARADDEADMVLLANLLDPRSEGIPGVTVVFEISRPGMTEPVKVIRVATDVRGQAAAPIKVGDLEPEQGMALAARARRLAEADRKTRILVRATAETLEDQFGRVLRTEWTEFSFDRPPDPLDGWLRAEVEPVR